MKRKFVILEDQGKIIAILNDKDNDIKVRGIAICHEGDTFNVEIGKKLSNLYALRKYYNKKVKQSEDKLKYIESVMVDLAEMVTKRKAVVEYSTSKLETIKQEIDELLKTL